MILEKKKLEKYFSRIQSVCLYKTERLEIK